MKKTLSKLAAILAVSAFLFGGLLVSCSPHGTGIDDGQSAGGGGAGGGGTGGGGTDGGGAGGGGGPIATYTVTYDDGVSDADISVPSDTTRYKTGDTVTVKFDGIGTREGYTFKGWKKGSDTYTSTGTKTFTMGSENVTLTAQWKSPWIGSKAPTETKVVGDIVFTDGSATPLGSPLDAEQQSKAIAVIFYVGTGLNSGDDTATSRTLGVGLARSEAVWCAEEAAAYNKNVTTIQCSWTEVSDGIYTFSGDKNGSDNLDQIAAFLKTEGAENDTGIAVEGDVSTKTPEQAALLYPAFYLAKKYKDMKIGSETESRLSGTAYEDGWYLPTVAELYEIYKVQESVNSAIVLCGGNKIHDAAHASSTQSVSTQTVNNDAGFTTWEKSFKRPEGYTKRTNRVLRAIREF